MQATLLTQAETMPIMTAAPIGSGMGMGMAYSPMQGGSGRAALDAAFSQPTTLGGLGNRASALTLRTGGANVGAQALTLAFALEQPLRMTL